MVSRIAIYHNQFNKTSVICLHTLSKKSIKHKSFVCTQCKCQTVLFDPLIGPYQVISLW